MAHFKVEVTDTYAGEANYCFVKHYGFNAPTNATDAQLVRKAKRAAGWTGRHTKETHGETLVIRPQGACLIMFVEFVSETDTDNPDV